MNTKFKAFEFQMEFVPIQLATGLIINILPVAMRISIDPDGPFKVSDRPLGRTLHSSNSTILKEKYQKL